MAIIVGFCDNDGDDDNVAFDTEAIRGECIKQDADYERVRIKFTGQLGNARIPMQIDIALGDVMHPNAKDAAYPTLHSSPGPSLRVCTRETVVAEKSQAMVHLGTVNSRMKDFHDS